MLVQGGDKVEKVLKGYIFRLYPTEEQKVLIEKSFGCSRYIYNYFLDKTKGKKYIKTFDYIKDLPHLSKEKEWLKEVDSCSLRCSIFNLEDALKRHNKGNAEYPKFKSKVRSRSSYRTNNITCEYKGKIYNFIEVNLKENIIKLPKLKEIKIRGYRNLDSIKGRIINATIYKEAGKYYASVCVEEYKDIPEVPIRRVIGIDVGVKELVTTSDGIIVKNMKFIDKYEKKLKGLNKWLSRCQKGSKNREKVKHKLQEVYSKLKNARKSFLHKISKEIVEENDLIITEKLKINKMVQNSRLSKKIYDVSWYELIRQLIYKSKWKGKICYQIDTYYPSSQTCNRCNHINKSVKNLKVRKWECPNCTNINDRDINASINIMWEGIKSYINFGGNIELQVK